MSMATFSLRVLPLLVSWLLILQLALAKVSPSCMVVPPLPYQARFKTRGGFQGRLRCPDLRQDIALNSPGDGGMLLCDPNSHYNYELENVRNPVCLPKKIPTKIQVVATVSYAVRQCEGPWAKQMKASLKNLAAEIFMGVPDPCGPSQVNCYERISFKCGLNKQYPESVQPQQLDLTLTLTTDYNQDKGLDFYKGVAETIRKRARFKEWSGLTLSTRTLWDIEDADFVYLHVSSWRGVCSIYANTVGTDLQLDKVLTCRGCPKKYVLDMGRCGLCSLNNYAPQPFASRCLPCPSADEWEDKKKMEDLCRRRP